ncbi:MAG: hypothetical protein IKK94_05015, partial [Clostridia bacterium]|nr:hypothetical protein [Clostridia bacterium]
FEIKPLRFFGESFEFECVDAYGHANNTIFTGTYAFWVLLGTKWYILPYTPTFKPEIYTLKSYPMQDGVGQGLTERQMILTREIGEFKIPIETPTGYYRLSSGGLSHDIVINKDVRANIIDISDIGGIERIDAQIREIIPSLYYGEPFEGGFVYCDYTLLGLEKEGELLRATVAICHRNYSNSGDPTDFIGKTYPAIINFKEERGKYIIESTISPETAWTDVTKHFGEGIITNINSALDAMTNKAFAEAIEYYNIDAGANIKAIIDETFEFVSTSEESNPYENYNFSRNGGKLRYYGEFALEYFFEEYVKGESEGVYDEVLKALLPYVTGFNDKSAKSFSDLFERTYNLAEYEKNKTIIKYSPVLSSFLEIVPSEKYRERFYINNPSFARLESKNILDTSELELLFTYNYEKKNTEYFFYVTKTEPKRFKVGYKDEDGDIITNTANIPSQFLYESSEPLLMDYRDKELFYVVKLMREDDAPIYLKFIIESNKFYPSPRPVPNFEQITEREAEALLSEQKG